MQYPMFNIVVTRTNLYIESLKIRGTKQTGISFYFPLLWCTLKNHTKVQHWNKFKKIAAWIEVECFLGYYAVIDFGHPFYYWNNVHIGFT